MKGTCEICGKQNNVHKNRQTGQYLCLYCQHKSFSRPRVCSVCGQLRPIWKSSNGKALCNPCYSKDYRNNHAIREKCSVCGRLKLVAARMTNGQAICHNCYRKDPVNFRRCIICGLKKAVEKLNADGQSICPSCYFHLRYHDKTKHKKCIECGEVRHVAARTENGKPICATCQREIREMLASRGKQAVG